jgi:hypothetical protein
MKNTGIFSKTYSLLLLVLLIFSITACNDKEDFTLKGEIKEPIFNLMQDLQVFYRSFHLANYCVTDTLLARRVFGIKVKNVALNTTISVNYLSSPSIYNPLVYNPSITSGAFEIKYQNPYLSNFTYYATLNLVNVKNNSSTYNGKIIFNKSFISANQSYYYIYTDSLKVEKDNKVYYLRGNLTLDEQFNANASFAIGQIEAYNGMDAKLVLTDYFNAENDYPNRFGLKDKLSYNFRSGKAIFYQGNYRANLMIGDFPKSEGHVPSFNVTDSASRYFSPYPQF